MTNQELENKYNEWSQMTKKQLLAEAQELAQKYGIAGCNEGDNKTSIIQFLVVAQNQALIEQCRSN